MFDEQIAAGENLSRAIASARSVAALRLLSTQLSAWSASNEVILLAVVGESECQAYCLLDGSSVAERGLAARRNQLRGAAEARIQYLRLVATRVQLKAPQPTGRAVVKSADDGPANEVAAGRPSGGEQEQPPHKSRLRSMLLNPWTIGIGAPLIAGAVIAASTSVISGLSHRTVLVTGTIVCNSGRPIVAAWIAASSGQKDSGYAHLGPADTVGTSSPVGAIGTYSYRLSGGGSYAVHVGCGGDAADWASRNYSPLLFTSTAHLVCHDPVKTRTGATPVGRCDVVTRAP